MDCNEYYELVSSAVDNRLTGGELASFHEHGRRCPRCHREFENERLTKRTISSRMKMVRTPAGLLQQISDSLDLEARTVASTALQGWRAFFARPAVKPAFAFAVTCVAVILLLSFPDTPQDGTTSTASLDFMEQSLSNYHSVVKGDIKPQLASSAPEHLLSFFTGKTDFPVVLPKMKDCSLIGGVSNELAGIKLAHVMYKHGDETIYIYQACWEMVEKSGKVWLPEAAKDELKRAGWFAKSYPDGYTVVLWTKNRTLCSAVAHMGKDDLIACLNDGETQGGSGW